jgi:hypothetical protein
LKFSFLREEKIMPRLVGKQSNNSFVAAVVLVIALVATAGTAEYYGYTDFVPNWGKTQQPLDLSMAVLSPGFYQTST